MTRYDDVDAVYSPGQLIVLTLAAIRAAVGEADHHGVNAVRRFAFGHTGRHGSLGGFNRILQDHAGIGGTIVGAKAEDSEQEIVHTAPLQNGILFHAVVGEGIPHGLGVALLTLLGRPIVGIDNGGNGISAIGSGVQHTDETALEVVVLVVAEDGDVIPHSAHHAQLDS